jgi:hypothetical protein
MDDDTLLSFALDLLDPADRAAVAAHLAAHPEDAARVDRLRQALRPLEADRDGYDPPRGLAAAAIARTAEYLVANGLVRAEPEPEEPRPVPATVVRRPDDEPVFPVWWRRADALVAAGIAFLAFGLLAAGVGRLRHDAQVVACQDGLRGLHAALTDYSDTHGGRYPEVGTRQVPVAGAFAAELTRNGHLPPSRPVACPVAPAPESIADPRVVPAVGYAYTLGYVGPGHQVTGLRRSDAPGGASDWTAVAADLPAPRDQAPHARGQNVLYLGGMVRFATTPAAGVNGDDIYHNDAGVVRAGLHVLDASLGRPTDVP